MDVRIEDADTKIEVVLSVSSRQPNYRVPPEEVAKLFARLFDDLRLRVVILPERNPNDY